MIDCGRRVHDARSDRRPLASVSAVMFAALPDFQLCCRLMSAYIVLATKLKGMPSGRCCAAHRLYDYVRDLGGPLHNLCCRESKPPLEDWRLISEPHAPLILSIFQERSGS